MPVEDHPVHESVRQGADARYGCWGITGEEIPAYWVPVRSTKDFLSPLKCVMLEHTMSTECRYDMSLSDPKCEGCKHRGSGEAYDKRVRENGK